MTDRPTARRARAVTRRIGGLALAVAMVLIAAISADASATTSRSSSGSGRTLNVLSAPYDAAGDGVRADTVAIQNALNDANGKGDVVLLPAGHTFLSGNLEVGSDTTLKIEGTLLQSQSSSDYTYTPIPGYEVPTFAGGVSAAAGDTTAFHNQPLVYAGNQKHVRVVGSGTIQMMGGTTKDGGIKVIAIGLYRVDGYGIRDLSVLGAQQYSIALFSTEHGSVQGVNVDSYHATVIPGLTGGNSTAPGDMYTPGSDAISLQNSQHVQIIGNTVHNGDDAMYVWESWKDPRAYQNPLGGHLWWSTDNAQPSTDIEFAHNNVAHSGGMGIGFIPWGNGAPDPRQVEISNVRIHDNVYNNPGKGVYCWCDASIVGHPSGQSPITDVRFYGNTYVGGAVKFHGFTATNLQTDFGAMSSGTVLNGDFKQSTAWWTVSGDAGSTDTADALRSPGARAAYEQLGRTVLGHGTPVGFLQPNGRKEASLTEGLGLGPIAASPIPTGKFDLTASLVTGTKPVTMSAVDTCTGQTLASKTVSSPTVSTQTLSFAVPAACANVRVGVTASGGNTWALVKNVAVTGATPVVDSVDPSVVNTGTWKTIANSVYGGSDSVGFTAGATATIPFTGSRAVLLAVKDKNLGIMDVVVDGTAAGSVDLYNPTQSASEAVFDTGDLTAGPHTLKLVVTGKKNAASTGSLVDWDVLLYQP